MEPGVNTLTLSWRACIVMMLTSILVTVPDWALAQTSTVPPVADVFCTAALWMTGPIGTAVATICVAIAGLGAILGKLTWGLAMLIGANVARIRRCYRCGYPGG
jgi:type IV secretory pathway VirB2 component (pilin)